MYSKELIKGSLKTLLLSLLDEQGEMYGYEITQTVKERTSEGIQLTEGALYPALHKLEDKGFVSTHHKIVNGRNRKYYTLTPEGKSEAEKAKKGWKQFSSMMEKLMQYEFYA